jgi:hypothetical protein
MLQVRWRANGSRRWRWLQIGLRGTGGAHERWTTMDDPPTKREIWFLVLGTIMVQVPLVAIAAFVIISQ